MHERHNSGTATVLPVAAMNRGRRWWRIDRRKNEIKGYANYISVGGNGTRTVLLRVVNGIHFNLRFGPGEHLGESNERQVGGSSVLVARHSTGIEPDSDDYESRFQSGECRQRHGGRFAGYADD